MRFALLTKRFYTNKDLMRDRFGRLFHLPNQLGRLGHRGIVVAGDLYSNASETLTVGNVEFHSLPLSLPRVPRFVARAGRLLGDFAPDVLVASGDSYLGYMGLRLARRLSLPFVFDVYDDYTAFRSNRLPGMKGLFWATTRQADLVVTSSEPLRVQIAPSNERIVVVQNGFDPELFRPMDKAHARTGLGIPVTDTVIGYFGSIRQDLGIAVLLRAAELLRTESPRLRVLLAGHDAGEASLAGAGVDYRGFLPQEQVPRLINACDVVAIPYLSGRQVEKSNACKIAEYIACRVPIVATKVSDHERIFASVPRALCEPGSAESMAAALKAQLSSPEVIEHSAQLAWPDLAEKLSRALAETV